MPNLRKALHVNGKHKPLQMQEFFEFLRLKDWTPKKCYTVIDAMDDGEIHEVINHAISLIPTNDSTLTSTKFSFVANKTLSGGTFPCFEEKCRLKNIDTLARNSILYADTVYIDNPFEKYLHITYFNDHSRYLLSIDIKLLFYVKALLEEGIFKFTASFYHICKDCLRETKAITKSYEKKIEKAEEQLTEKILSDFQFILDRDDEGDPFVRTEGPYELIEHPTAIYFYDDKLQKFKKNLGNKTDGNLSRKQILDLGLANMFVDPIIDDLLTQNYYLNVYSSSYLTHPDIDAKIIRNNHTKKDNEINNKINQSLSHKVPFVRKYGLGKIN